MLKTFYYFFLEPIINSKNILLIFLIIISNNITDAQLKHSDSLPMSAKNIMSYHMCELKFITHHSYNIILIRKIGYLPQQRIMSYHIVWTRRCYSVLHNEHSFTTASLFMRFYQTASLVFWFMYHYTWNLRHSNLWQYYIRVTSRWLLQKEITWESCSHVCVIKILYEINPPCFVHPMLVILRLLERDATNYLYI